MNSTIPALAHLDHTGVDIYYMTILSEDDGASLCFSLLHCYLVLPL